MFGPIKISPSVLSADFMNMERSVRAIEQAGADFVHIDVMDGHFVPNLTMGVPFIAHMRKITELPLDVHLMIDNPTTQIPWYLEAGVDYLTVHVEAFDKGSEEVFEALETIREAGVHPALTVKPDTPVEVFRPYLSEIDMALVMGVYPGFSGQSFIEGTERRIARVVELAQAAGVSPLIEVDGGIGVATAPRVISAGADVLVAGNAVFGASDIGRAVSTLREAAKR